MELLPWDGWGLIDRDDGDITPDDLALLDHVAALTTGGNETFAEVRTIYQDNDHLCVPSVIHSYTDAGVQMIDLTRVAVG